VGVERAVTRWYVQRQVILDEIATLQASLINLQNQQAQQPATGQLTDEAATEAGTRANTEAIAEIEGKLAEAQTRLRELGPCPKTMMG
jgi:hypothetical protein